jgi:transcriptional regulator with XRE-family HTH domain
VPEAGGSAGSPTVRRRELGSLLRALRNERGLTVDQVAAELLCSPSKVSRMETGHRGVTARDIRDLCRIYGVTDPAQQTRLTRLVAEGKQQGWWQSFELDNFATFVGLEEAATATKNFQSNAVPGLLQIPDYARAMHKANVPEMSAGRIDELIQVRLTRQRSLAKEPPLQLSAILDEAVLRRLVGGYRVMRDQVRHLANAAQWPNVTIQIIPFSAGAHPAMESTFDILEFGDTALPSVVYVEGLAGNMYLERLPDLQRYEQVFDYLRQIALSPQDSIELLAETAEQYDRAAVPAEYDPGSNVE